MLPKFGVFYTSQVQGEVHERNIYFAALQRIASLPANAKVAEAKAIAQKALEKAEKDNQNCAERQR